MSIIYSYPEQGALNADDLLIGTSVEKVGGKQKNITRNFSVQQIANFINRGVGFVDPVATDFQIPVFNQGGLKITGSIMSQDSSPSNGVAGGGITVAGTLTTTQSLTVGGGATIGNTVDSISLNSPTSLLGSILDSTSTQGGLSQILVSNQSGKVNWVNYEAGLTYEGTWDAANNTINGTTYSPALLPGIGNSGHFYIVNVQGTTSLGAGLNDWHVGDWAVFLDEGTQPASWQKIDNTSALNGTGTDNKIAMWTGGVNPSVTLTDSLISQAGAVVSVDGSLNTNGSIGNGVANYDITTSATNQNLRVKGNGTGGLEVRGDSASLTDAKITLNCYQNTHGVTIQSPPHIAGATYTLVLPTTTGNAADVLTSSGSRTNPQLVWTTPTTGTVTNFTTVSTAIPGITAAVTNPTTTPTLTLGITGTPTAALFLDGTGNWSSPGGGVTDITATAPLNADVSTGSVTLSMPAYATATGGYVPIGGASGEYLDGLSGNWTSLPISGVTSVTGDTITIAATAGNTPVISAITTGGVGTGLANLATGGQIQAAIDTALAGAVTFKGTFNANTGSITGTSDFLYNPGALTNTIAIAIGDMYVVSTAGNFYGVTALNVGDEVIAVNAAAINQSLIGDWNAVPSAGAGVLSVLPVTPTTSTGTPLVITPAGGTGAVTIKSTAYAGQSNVGHVPAGGVSGQYLDGDTGSWLTLPAGGVTGVAFSNTLAASTGDALSISPTTGAVIVNAKRFDGDSKPGVITATSGDSANFLRGDGQWAAPTGAVATKTVDTFTGSLQSFIDLTVEASGVNYIDMYIDGVYQAKATYTISTVGVISRLTLVSGTFPTGVSIETVTTT